MAAAMKGKFNGSMSFTDAHDIIQEKVGNTTWLREFFPIVQVPEKKKRGVALAL